MTEDEFKSRPTAGAGHETPPQQVTPGRPAEPPPIRDVPTPPQHDRLAADWPAPKRARPVKPKVRKRLEPPRFSLPDWSKVTWLFTVGLTMLVIFAFLALAGNQLAREWAEALFGKVGGLVGG